MEVNAKGEKYWPSQDAPSTFDADRIVAWFYDNGIYALNQGCDGFTFCRNNLAKPKATYGYLWVETVLDLDMDMAYLLDIRRTSDVSSEDFDESRQYLFVANGYRGGPVHAWHDQPVKFLDLRAAKRLVPGLHWFAEQVDQWLTRQGDTP